MRTEPDRELLGATEDLASERAVIGRVLDDCATIPGLTPEHFRGSPYRAIYSAALRLEARGKFTFPELCLALGNEVERNVLLSVMAGAPPAKLTWQFVARLQELSRIRTAVGQADAFSRALLEGDRARADEHWDAARSALSSQSRIPAPRDLYGDDVRPQRPEFIASNLFRRYGVALAWAQPGGWKTSTTMRMVHELIWGPTARPGCSGIPRSRSSIRRSACS